ncbi:MAG: hypothetical protein HeimC3_44970 [Candidatus Heimdallarchaeota archaeon LC_3]|nr:MAG: hypothetical protein HeimC3_44970 [Candidatus Heimdallarchaeota archaeon LC_3]
MFWAPPIPQDLYFPIGFIFTLIGLFSVAWLLFYLEHSRDLPRPDRTIGILFRLLIMSLFLGFGLFLLSMVDLI